MRQWNQEGAVEGIPLQLIIIAIILAISLPIIFMGLDNADHSQTENNLKGEINAIKAMARSLFNGGVGNSDIIEVNFKNGLMTTIDYVKFGNNLASGRADIISYQIIGDSPMSTEFNSPEIPLTSENDETLIVTSGGYILGMECMRTTTIDIDNDGIFNDLYIQIKII